jgi:aminoglycoside 2'-N-acetyltransferase I
MTDHDWEHALGGVHALVWEGADLIGHGAAMRDALETVVRGAHELGVLGATDEAAAFYAARGWMPRRGPSSALTPSGIRRTGDDDGCIYVLPVQAPLDLSGELTCVWRDGDLW